MYKLMDAQIIPNSNPLCSRGREHTSNAAAINAAAGLSVESGKVFIVTPTCGGYEVQEESEEGPKGAEFFFRVGGRKVEYYVKQH